MKYTKTFHCADEADEIIEQREERGLPTAVEYHDDGGATLWSSQPFTLLDSPAAGRLVLA